MDEEQKAYQKLMQGIQNYVKDMVYKYSDKTYTGIIKSVDDDGYTVSINGIEYPNITTIGGTCAIQETVRVLVPQGRFSNMFILKGDNNSQSETGVSSVNGKTGDVVLTSSDVGAVSTSNTESSNIDFSGYFS